MPAILRILLPKWNALIPIITPYAVYDRVGVRTAGSATVSYGRDIDGLQHSAMSDGVCGASALRAS
jgi:hypothetical protein